MESIGKLIQDLFHSNNAKVYAALDALTLHLREDNKNRESIVTAGGYFAADLLTSLGSGAAVANVRKK
jgi:hypothetical protein